MVVGPFIHRKPPLGRFLFGFLVVLIGSLTASGQQTDQLQQELQKLKQQYEATTRDHEQRIANLEQQIEKEKEAREKAKEATVSAVALAQEVAKKTVLGDSD
jgi:hypothetical protein